MYFLYYPSDCIIAQKKLIERGIVNVKKQDSYAQMC